MRFIPATGRTASIRILPRGEVVVRVPAWMGEERAQKWVEKHLPKIERRLKRIPSDLVCVPTRLARGEVIRILDTNYVLEIAEAARSGVRSENERILISGPNTGKRRAALQRWICRQLLPEAQSATRTFAERIGASVKICSVRNYRSRLGACISRSRLVFHYGLAFLPQAHRQVIYAHEVAHLKHNGHQPDFRATHLALVPDGRRLEREAKALGAMLRI